jgi:hypothetical protein
MLSILSHLNPYQASSPTFSIVSERLSRLPPFSFFSFHSTEQTNSSLKGRQISPHLKTTKHQTSSSHAVKTNKKKIETAAEELHNKLNDLAAKYKLRRDYLLYGQEWTDWVYDKLDSLADKSQYYTLVEGLLSEKIYGKIEWSAEQIDEACDTSKTIKPALDIILNLAISKMSQNAQYELLQIQKEYNHYFSYVQHEKINSCQKRIVELQKEMLKNQRGANKEIKKANFKLDQQLTSRLLSIPFAKWLGGDRNGIRKTLKNSFDLIGSFQDWWETRKALAFQKECRILLQPELIISSKEENEKYDEVKQFIESLKKCKTFLEVKAQLKTAKIEVDILDWADWETKIKSSRLEEMLIQQYQLKKGLAQMVNIDQVNLILKKRQLAFETNVKEAEGAIGEFLTTHADRTFAEIQEELKKIHVSLTEQEWTNKRPLEKPMSLTKEKWEEQSSSNDCLRAYLAEQVVKHEEMSAIMSLKGLTEGRLKKIEIERRPLKVYQVTQLIEIGFSILEIILSIPYVNQFIFSYLSQIAFSRILVNYLATKINFRGSELLYFFLDIETTIGGILKQVTLRAIEFLFIRQVKPHLYSPQAYLISLHKKWVIFQKSWIEITRDIYCCLSYLHKLTMQLSTYLIDSLKTRIYGTTAEKKANESTKTNYNEFENRLQTYIKKQNAKIETKKIELAVLKDKLKQLKLKDFNLAMQAGNRSKKMKKHPTSGAPFPLNKMDHLKQNYREAYEAQPFNPVKEIVKGLMVAIKSKHLPEHVNNFLKQKFNINAATMEEPKLEAELEKVFTSKDSKMLKIYQQAYSDFFLEEVARSW